jgi:alkyl hydroperoxide reductase subunit AhpF
VLLYGSPAGYELVTLLAALVDLGGGAEDDELVSQVARYRLGSLSSDVQVTVFASPGCPYSPHMARLAFRFAMASPLVTAAAVEVTSFPALAKRHRVNAVPHIDINGAETVIGAVPELELLDAIAAAAWRPPAN